MMDRPQDSQTDTYPFRWGLASDIGRIREANEDVVVVEPEMGLFVVLDGMGGHRGGAIAAQSVAADLPGGVRERLATMRVRRSRSVRRWLARLIGEQNRQLFLQGTSTSGCEGMGTTVVMALLLNGRAYVANLGDSRAYRLRAGRLTQLSRDHSVIAELLERGEIEPDQTAHHPAQGLVTQYLGMPEDADPHVRACALRAGDRLLLCTDGLTDQVKDATICDLVDGQADCQAACDVLVQMANAKGGHDNVTVALIHWLGPGPKRPEEPAPAPDRS